jgi:hypothetical protein
MGTPDVVEVDPAEVDSPKVGPPEVGLVEVDIVAQRARVRHTATSPSDGVAGTSLQQQLSLWVFEKSSVLWLAAYL